MRGNRIPFAGIATTLLVAICLLTGCSGDSSNASKGDSEPRYTTTSEAGHSTNTSEKSATGAGTTMAGSGNSCNDSEQGPTAKERPVAKDARLIRLTYMGDAAEPVFSPDGERIAFANYTGDLKVRYGQAMPQGSPELYVMNSDGTHVTCIADLKALGGGVEWSPDGTRIAYSVPDSTGNYEIYVEDVDGTNERSLTNGIPSAAEPAWSPNGEKIAFGVTLNEGRTGNGEIAIMNADGTGPTNLTNTPPTTSEGGPSFSPNGQRIAFWSSTINKSTNKGGTDRIYVMNPDGTNRNLLSGQLAYGSDPRFSPDGDQIAFLGGFVSSSGGLVTGSYVMNSDGTNPIQVGDERSPGLGGAVFFPNRQRIAITRHTKGGTDQIYAVNTDGTTQSKLTNNDSANDSFPTFSPDGKKMAFGRVSYDDSGKLVSEIYVMKLD